MKTIAWDVDDVLNDLTREWFHRAWLPAHPDCPIRYEQLSANPPHELLGVSKAAYLASLDEFRLSAAAAEMPPLAPVLQWFARHGEESRHVAITAAPLKAAPASAAWVMRHFGRWIRSFHLIPSHREGERAAVYDRSKGEALGRWRQVDLLVDDDAANLASAQDLGIQTLPVPRPWNRCVMSWDEVLGRLTQWVRTGAEEVPCQSGSER